MQDLSRRLGRTELVVPAVGLGGAWLRGRNGELSHDHGVATVRRALDLGVRFVDTAECYINGESERIVGEALAHDTRPVVGTKFGHTPTAFDWSRDAVVASVERSLSKLGRSQIDLLHVHTPIEPTIESLFRAGGALDGMRDLRDRGAVRFFGITGRDLDFLRRCVATDFFDTLLVFQRFDLLEQSADTLFQEAASHDMGIIGASPLRLGLFGTARQALQSSLDPADANQVDALSSLFANEPGGLAGGAFRFVLGNPKIHVVLSGATSPSDIEAISAYSLLPPLSEDIVARVRQLADNRVRDFS